MKRKRVWLCVGIVVATLFISPIAWFYWWMNRPFGTGSVEYAKEWKARFASVRTPEDARRKFGAAVALRRFPNGEWVFGVCKDSHRYTDGGTVVLKDSTGTIHAFFGHVCGSHALDAYLNDGEEVKSLKEFYGGWFFEKWEFTEYWFD